MSAQRTRRKTPPVLNYQNPKQRDLAGQAHDACPTCGKPWGRTAIKVCRLCGGIISPTHKWNLIPAGPGLFALQHVDCNHPEASRAEVQQRRESARIETGAGDAPARVPEAGDGREDAAGGG